MTANTFERPARGADVSHTHAPSAKRKKQPECFTHDPMQELIDSVLRAFGCREPSSPRQSRKKYAAGRHFGPEDAWNLNVPSERAWELLGHTHKLPFSSFGAYLSLHSPPEYLAAAFGCAVPAVKRNYCLHFNKRTTVLMQQEGENEAAFRTMCWSGEADIYDGKRHGAHVRQRSVHCRCLVPLDGFFVSTHGAGAYHAKPYYLRPEPLDAAFAVAAIMDPRYPITIDSDCHPVIIMTIPAPLRKPELLQHALPMALPQAAWKRWVRPGELTEDEVEAMARSCAGVKMTWHPVGQNFYKYRSDDERCILSEEAIRARGWEVEP